MVRVDTQSVVAGVQDAHTFGYGAKFEFVGDAVCVMHSSGTPSEAEISVSVSRGSGGPRPAFVL